MEHPAARAWHATGPKDDRDVLLAWLAHVAPGEREFHQAVQEALPHLLPILRERPAYREAAILQRLLVPDRGIQMRVSWVDDEGRVRVNRAWRVQFNNALGPYKGGLRFHPDLNPSVLKFLAFEQTLKNALTGLPLGGAKGGADFDPKNKSDGEVMRFCQALMIELHRYLGPDVDIPAGDIGVGPREIGFLYGQYKRLAERSDGAFTGKSRLLGGSFVRIEATGYGLVRFAELMLAEQGETLEGKRCVLSGAGNVALHAASCLMERGATVLALSDTSGTVYAPRGLTTGELEAITAAKEAHRVPLADLAPRLGLEHRPRARPWSIPCDCAFPCATQNELDEEDAAALLAGGCRAVAEGANMPCTLGAVRRLREAGVLFAPGKAANAGGVAVSALEMSQNAIRLPWPREEVARRLDEIMTEIHRCCVLFGRGADGRVDYERGANVAAFRRVADAMLAQGVV